MRKLIRRHHYATRIHAVPRRRKKYGCAIATTIATIALTGIILIGYMTYPSENYQYPIEISGELEGPDEERTLSSSLLQNKEGVEVISTKDRPDEGRKVEELHLYLHVGPIAMATTTFQNSLAEDRIPLNKDGYCVYDPIKMRDKIGPTIQSSPALVIQTSVEWNELTSFLDRCYSLQKNVLLSSEHLGLIESDVWNDDIKPAFSQWEIHIVFGYRRYYEWIPNLHFQIFQNKNRNIPNINMFIANDNATNLLYTDNVLRHWKSLVGHDFDFLIYNMHEDRNVMKTIYCKMLPNTKHSCLKHSQHLIDESQNICYPPFYKLMVIQAIRKGRLPDATNLEIASMELERMHQAGLTPDIPRTCMDDEALAKLLEKSIEMEKVLVPDWFLSENGEQEIRRKFKTFAEKELCGVGVLKVGRAKEYSDMWETLLDNYYIGNLTGM